jgi:hypothetical protein
MQETKTIVVATAREARKVRNIPVGCILKPVARERSIAPKVLMSVRQDTPATKLPREKWRRNASRDAAMKAITAISLFTVSRG